MNILIWKILEIVLRCFYATLISIKILLEYAVLAEKHGSKEIKVKLICNCSQCGDNVSSFRSFRFIVCIRYFVYFYDWRTVLYLKLLYFTVAVAVTPFLSAGVIDAMRVMWILEP